MIKSIYLKEKGWHYDMPSDRKIRRREINNIISVATDVLCSGHDVNVLVRGNFFDWDDKEHDEFDLPSSYWMYFTIHQLVKYNDYDGSCKLVVKVGKTQNCYALKYKPYVTNPESYKAYCFNVGNAVNILEMLLSNLDSEWA